MGRHHVTFGMTVSFELTDTELSVHMTGVSGVLALKTRIHIPLEHVTDARVVATKQAKAEGRGFKVGGHIPGLVKAGSFGIGEAKQFWYVLRAEQVLVVDLADDQYKRLVLEVDDPAAAAEQIKSKLPS